MNQAKILRLNNTVGHDLRDASAGMAGAGKIHPVDPAAVAKYRQIIAQQEAGKPVRKRPSKKPSTLDLRTRKQRMENINLTKPLVAKYFYSPAVIEAATAELEAVNTGKLKRPRPAKVFAASVVATWRELRALHPQITNDWLAKNNGLIKVTGTTILRYLKNDDKVEPAAVPPVSESAVEAAASSAETADDDLPSLGAEPPNLPAFLRRSEIARPPAQPTAVSELIALLDRPGVRVRGKLHINADLEIEFGGNDE